LELVALAVELLDQVMAVTVKILFLIPQLLAHLRAVLLQLVVVAEQGMAQQHEMD
jgi:hypothetical protein